MRTKRSVNGWVNLHKPIGMTSADAVHRVKRLIRPEKIGHAGTLDPLASGILPLALGEATKCVPLLMDAKKTYHFSVTFGERRTTDDAEGEVVARSGVIPSQEAIRAILPEFTGEILQIPPVYSAIKQGGKRAYALARAGQEVTLSPRKVQIHTLELLKLKGNLAEFQATVGKGTYIRSLARDIAQALGSEGYISRLHRAAVGNFHETSAISLDFLEKSAHSPANFEGGIPSWLLPACAALDDIPAVTIGGSEWQKLRHGHGFTLSTPVSPAAMVGVFYQDVLVALAESDGTMLRPKRLLNVM
jgi:tRNA pseudouridine55 synthase